MAVNVTLNGEAKQLDAPTSVRGLLESLGLDPAKIAVERNLEIVPRGAYGDVAVADGDRLEIVHFIGGGNAPVTPPREDKPFTLAGKTYKSRLIIGTGKFKDYAQNAAALEASGAEIVTVAVRRVKSKLPLPHVYTKYLHGLDHVQHLAQEAGLTVVETGGFIAYTRGNGHRISHELVVVRR